MTLDDLTDDERLALVALLKLVVRADHELSEGEVRELKHVAQEMGEERWKHAVARASERFRTHKDVSQFAETIMRPEARRLIYKLLVRAAKPDRIVPEEASVLFWLAKLWRLEQRS